MKVKSSRPKEEEVEAEKKIKKMKGTKKANRRERRISISDSENETR